MSDAIKIILFDLVLFWLVFAMERYVLLPGRKGHFYNWIKVAALIAWIVAIFYVSFGYDSYSHENPDINLVPFSSLYDFLVSGTSLIKSRFVFQFFLYLPLGMFVGIMAWKNRQSYNTGLFSMFVFCILVEVVQFFILKKDGYIDDVLAGILAILISYSATMLFQFYLGKRHTENRILPQISDQWTPFACKLIIVCICGLLAIICFLQLITRDGIFPYSSLRIPVGICLPSQEVVGETERQVYTIQYCDSRQKCESIANHFDVLGDMEENEGYDVYIRDKTHGSYVSVRTDGTWTYINGADNTTAGTVLEQSEYEEIIQKELKPLLRQNEAIEVKSISHLSDAIDNQSVLIKAEIMQSANQNELAWNNWVYIIFESKHIMSIEYCLVRCTSVRAVPVITMEDAFKTAKIYGLRDYDHFGTGYFVEKMEYGYCRYRDEVYPSYVFSGSYTDQNSITQQWQSTIDAVDRGILPYIIPGGILLILLAAAVTVIQRKSVGRKGQALTPATSSDGQTEEEI